MLAWRRCWRGRCDRCLYALFRTSFSFLLSFLLIPIPILIPLPNSHLYSIPPHLLLLPSTLSPPLPIPLDPPSLTHSHLPQLFTVRRNKLHGTQLVINRLIRATVETGVVTAACALVELIMFEVLPNTNLHLFL